MTPTPQELYAQREQRFNDIVALKKPDRVPLVPLVRPLLPRRASRASPTATPATTTSVRMDQRCSEATLEFGWDFAPPNGMSGSRRLRGACGPSSSAGRAAICPTTRPSSSSRSEYVKADEVDEFLADPNGFTLTHDPAAHRRRPRGPRADAAPAAVLVLEHVHPADASAARSLTAPPLRKALETLLALCRRRGRPERGRRRLLPGRWPAWGIR